MKPISQHRFHSYRYHERFRQRVMIIHREKSDRRRYSVKSSHVEKSRLQLNVIHTVRYHPTQNLRCRDCARPFRRSCISALRDGVRWFCTERGCERDRGGGRTVVVLILRENKVHPLIRGPARWDRSRFWTIGIPMISLARFAGKRRGGRGGFAVKKRIKLPSFHVKTFATFYSFPFFPLILSACFFFLSFTHPGYALSILSTG